MGCVSSKKARSESPAFDDVYSGRRHSSASGRTTSSGSLSIQEPLGKIKEEEEEKEEEGRESGINYDDYSERGVVLQREACTNTNACLPIQFERMAEAELVAAGWPPWLSSVAAEAIQGWLPLRSDAYERLDKVILPFLFFFFLI